MGKFACPFAIFGDRNMNERLEQRQFSICITSNLWDAVNDPFRKLS